MKKILKVMGWIIKLYLMTDVILYTLIGIGVWLEALSDSTKTLSERIDFVEEMTKENYKKSWKRKMEAQ